jgi:hypothetical protein
MGHVRTIEHMFLGGEGEMMRKRKWSAPLLLSFSTLALLWIPGVFAMMTSHVPNDIVVLVLLISSTAVFFARYRSSRRELLLWCIGATMVVTIVPYAAFDGHMWDVWGLFFPFLTAAFLNERMLLTDHLTSDSVFGNDDEARSFRSLTVSGLHGAAFILVVVIVSTMIITVLPWLSMGNAPLWLLGLLSIAALLSLAYIAANRP